jgi:hypothetical protein
MTEDTILKEQPRVLHFKSNQGAFEFACKYFNNSLTYNESEEPKTVCAIVLAVRDKDNYCVKIANGEDPSIPERPIEQLLADRNIKNVCFFAKRLDSVPILQKGDFCMFASPPQMRSLAAALRQELIGVITAKIHPSYDMETQGWLKDTSNTNALENNKKSTHWLLQIACFILCAGVTVAVGGYIADSTTHRRTQDSALGVFFLLALFAGIAGAKVLPTYLGKVVEKISSSTLPVRVFAAFCVCWVVGVLTYGLIFEWGEYWNRREWTFFWKLLIVPVLFSGFMLIVLQKLFPKKLKA